MRSGLTKRPVANVPASPSPPARPQLPVRTPRWRRRARTAVRVLLLLLTLVGLLELVRLLPKEGGVSVHVEERDDFADANLDLGALLSSFSKAKTMALEPLSNYEQQAPAGDSLADRWAVLPEETQRNALSEVLKALQGDALLLPLIRGDATPASALLTVVPELTGAEDGGVDMRALLRSVLSDRENDSQPPLAADSSPDEVQNDRLRRAVRTQLLTRYIRFLLLPLVRSAPPGWPEETIMPPAE